MKWYHLLSEILYPTCCPGCDRVTHSESVWCEDCLRAVWDPRHVHHPNNTHVSDCYTLCRYRQGIRRCILQLKYGKRRERAKSFPPLLARFPYWERLGAYDMVIPIPVTKTQMRERGYNQVDAIFQKYFQKRNIPYLPDFLIRKQDTVVQSTLSKTERYQNMKGAFLIHPHKEAKNRIQGKRILLVDDVYTTGATMDSAAQTLKNGGAKEVIGLTIASGAN